MVKNPKGPNQRQTSGGETQPRPSLGGRANAEATMPRADRRWLPTWGGRLSVTAGLGLGLLASGPVQAQEGGDESGVIYRQRTVYSFEGDTIDGDLMRPDGAYIEARKEIQHSNLIQVRDSFREKVLESVVHL